ncbi:DUF4175 domain-containing protein [Singulisphaera sp. PoT]|uniref:DUF4175 domain-containing protein n=1 Tax=Singulisphaera sp. PoT TaxID=3411797 RepID=UPI003BF4F298
MRSPDRHPARAFCRVGRTPADRVSLLSMLLVAITTAGLLPAAFGQAPPAPSEPAGVFDEEKKEGEAKADDAAPKKETVTDRDSIGFTQENVAAQMTELEERMFRLSEALRGLEPENASRLSLALKFSREELILHQMKSTQKLLKEAQLNKAETEVRELLAKLEHLRNLLLADDLDFQMKLARLRQMRESLSQLQRIIKEERREYAWSRTAVEQQGDRKTLQEKKATLEALVRDQKALIEETRAANAKDDADPAKPEAREKNKTKETDIRKRTASLAATPQFKGQEPPFLAQASPHFDDAITHLGTKDGEASLAAEGKALELLEKEQGRLDERLAAIDKELAPGEFQRFEQEQAKNRAAAESLAEASARLGQVGVPLQKDLIRSGGSMRSAEGDLAKTQAKPAADDQLAAIKHLVKADEELARSLEALLVELRSELQTRIIGELTEMHELQVAIRETTEAQAPRIAQHSRTALLMVTGLSPKEAELGDRTDQLAALTEETEFGIALPTALHVLSRHMRKIQDALKAGDASEMTVTLEKRVEVDILSLLEAMRRLPPTTPPPPGTPLPSEPRARERELNRLVAELKMIRLVQNRLNDDTEGTDKTRPKPEVLPPALRREIETLTSRQEEIHTSLAKIAEKLEAPQEAEETLPNPVDAIQ